MSNQKLFAIGNFDFRLQHLLIIGILILAVSIGMLIRSTPAQYGTELFEFDPFFNYRATNYILENGFDAYLEWDDEKTWHPFGRNVSESSQVMLHVTASIFYKLFGFNSSLYEFVIIFPVVIGSLTAVSVFAFVRVLGGTTAGLLAALMFSVSVPIFTRGLIGWFKSEPLGLFFAFIAMYLFVSGIMYNKGKISLIKLVFAGLFLSLGISAWGGCLFFLIPIMFYYIAMPFIKKENRWTIWAAPLFSFSFFAFSFLFERTTALTSSGAHPIGYAGLALLIPTLFVIIAEIIKKFSNDSAKLRNTFFLLIGMIISGIGVLFSGQVSLPGFRYLHSVNPLLVTKDPLTDSVAEHATTTIESSFAFLSIFIIFGAIGIWFLFSKKNDIQKNVKIFALIISISAIYVSSAFIRLELFASVALIILGSIGLSLLFKSIIQKPQNFPTKMIFFGAIIILFIIPLTSPVYSNWTTWADFKPTILNGGTWLDTTSNDWGHAMEWLKNNSPEDSVIVSWWDYGYWITTLSERTTLVDNATLNDWQIKKVAYSLVTTPENSWNVLNSHYTQDISDYIDNDKIADWGYVEESRFMQITENAENCNTPEDSTKIANNLEELLSNPEKEFLHYPIVCGLDADYIVIFIAGEKILIPDSSEFLYLLDGGADEAKKSWFMKISNHDPSQFVEPDGVTPNDYFMENSTLGKLMPFSIYAFVDPNTNRASETFQPGFIPIYMKDLKYVDPDKHPFYLVYASPNFHNDLPGPLTAVFIYKINPDYQF